VSIGRRALMVRDWRTSLGQSPMHYAVGKLAKSSKFRTKRTCLEHAALCIGMLHCDLCRMPLHVRCHTRCRRMSWGATRCRKVSWKTWSDYAMVHMIHIFFPSAAHPMNSKSHVLTADTSATPLNLGGSRLDTYCANLLHTTLWC